MSEYSWRDGGYRRDVYVHNETGRIVGGVRYSLSGCEAWTESAGRLGLYYDEASAKRAVEDAR